MNEKDLKWFHLQEVMAAIQNYLDQEATEGAALENYMAAQDVEQVLRDEAVALNPLPIVQFQLTRQKTKDLNTLNNLPRDFFVRC